MLETTLATTIAPGSNLKGDVTGANWSFLLPSLQLRRIVCIGMPLPSTLAVLSRIGESVLIFARKARQLHQTGIGVASHISLNVFPVLADWKKCLPIAPGGADLVFVADRDAAVQLRRGGPLVGRLRRLLGPEGLIYFEFAGLRGGLRGLRPTTDTGEGADCVQLYWITPHLGEAQTAVPAMDRYTATHFLRHGLFSLTCNPEIFRGRRSSTTISQQANPRRSRETLWADWFTIVERSVRTLSQKVRYGSVRVLGNLEAYLARKRLFERIAPRYGMLIGKSGAHPDARPPQYLTSLAQSSGVDITTHRWGLCAKGEYSSRKVLFFLFDGLDRAPQYVVKMTREPRFNPRLENEYRALSSLERCGLATHGALPRVAFFGHHGGIAIVGETAITGQPFRKQTTWAADCPYARSAINWLVRLGASTACASEATASDTADALHSLMRRFVQLYRPARHHHSFLAGQIQRIADSRAQLPAVFQHGDPGTWNVMASQSGNAVFLDWEAAEQKGIPLWDLFYFLRSYCVSATREHGVRDSLQGFAQHFLGESALSALVVRSTLEYSERCALPDDLVEPLFYTCWMHRALKEANRLAPAKLATGHYVSLLRLCIDERNARTLRRLFAMVPRLGTHRSSRSCVNEH